MFPSKSSARFKSNTKQEMRSTAAPSVTKAVRSRNLQPKESMTWRGSFNAPQKLNSPELLSRNNQPVGLFTKGKVCFCINFVNRY